uniref:Replication restart protein PriA n=1 Tax=uncultured Thiotrichaceae bacterium TaxID=298394 RepID=A0A6S6U956_9GAMM|nr:MAG: Helicase PriA essential for oriC/DnaA-independent DNA replication [uncultured Thiotrichaceae bacterium]
MIYELLVAVPRPFRTLLTYAANSSIAPGSRVSVPLGNTQTIGIVISSSSGKAHQQSSSDMPLTYVIKHINRLIDDEPLLDNHLIDFLRWSCSYYHHPPGEVFFAALPTHLKGERQLPKPTYWKAIPDSSAREKLQRAKKQEAMYHWLVTIEKPVTPDEIHQQFGQGWQSYLKGLTEKGFAETCEPSPIIKDNSKAVADTLELTDEQTTCLARCTEWATEEKPQPILLHGVTGSGKTEIYLRLINFTLQQDRQILVLVPEIGLTPQLQQRFRHFFPQRTIVSMHSALNDTERLDAWMQSRNQQADIIIGTRSSVFVPCPKLGLIVIDEEHDLSFKQQEGFRYHGRDLAIKRAHMLNIPVLMGSATPAMESLHNADRGRYHYIRLNKRPGKARQPTMTVQDTRGYQLQAGLSEQTLQALRTTLERNEQAMVFINRRGFAPVLMCPSCGWQAQCPECSSNMTFHTRGSRLICHHCGTDRMADNHCPDCRGQQLTTQGQGTERIELMLQQHFRDTDVLRIDRDSTSRKGELQRHLDIVHNTERLLLVGTQMLAKGHDFPNLTLVVILDIDQALMSSEYHALERFGQLLTQVAGRAGRGNKSGQVILQTTQPEHPVLLTLLQHGYHPFARQILEERQRWTYPPFGYQALIRASAKDMEAALDTLTSIRNIMQAQSTDIILMGPIPAPMEKRAGRYRAQLLVQAKNRQLRHNNLKQLTLNEKNILNKRGVRWSIDIDPVELS